MSTILWCPYGIFNPLVVSASTENFIPQHLMTSLSLSSLIPRESKVFLSRVPKIRSSSFQRAAPMPHTPPSAKDRVFQGLFQLPGMNPKLIPQTLPKKQLIWSQGLGEA